MAETFRPWRFAGALACLYGLLVFSDLPENWSALRFVRWPVELPILALALILAPTRRRSGVIRAVAAILCVLVVLKLANLTAYALYARTFNILVDPGLIGTALETVAMGQGMLAAAGIAVAAVAVMAGAFLAARRIAAGIADIPAAMKQRTAFVLGGLFLAAAPLGKVTVAWAWWPFASIESAAFLWNSATAVVEGLESDRAFAAAANSAAFDAAPDTAVLAGLRGHDVLIVFAEAYGRVALEDPAHGASLVPTLRDIEHDLAGAGLSARSAWLTSPTFGGQSWLAHGTFMSGLWLDNQRRYDSLFARDRGTLIRDFARGGWRTIAVMPAITASWIEAPWFGYDAIYDFAALDYAGPPFDYMTMPDQFALEALARKELARKELAGSGRQRIFAEIALVSSHMPWTPLPKQVAWNDLADGRMFDTARTPPRAVEWWNRDQLKRDYTDAIDYVLRTLSSFAVTYGRQDMVLIIVGDHQPMNIVGDLGGGRDVPVHIITSNPAILAAIDFWGWTAGMVPDAVSPVWGMDTMRGRLHSAFTPATQDKTAP
jgi:hypothetical protein